MSEKMVQASQGAALEVAPKREIIERVQGRIAEMSAQGKIQMPANYSYQNALRSAFLILSETRGADKRLVLESCSMESVSNALLEMVVQGLNPVKKQCYFIPYGEKLTMMRSYLGTIAITKRIPGVVDVKAYPVYANDVFRMAYDIPTGVFQVTEYTPDVTKRDAKDLIGAFAMILGKKGVLHTEYMTMEQIRKSWERGQTKGKSSAHTDFPDQMAVRTVVNRACKLYASTSSDSDRIAEILNHREDDEAAAVAQMEEQENMEILDIESELTEVVEEEATSGAPF
ncbi:MAG: RecT family recombinase [Peptostreptococcaceae bacterium]|nr:RecT family recombinase [Peptostreptococcaceae bacterium]